MNVLLIHNTIPEYRIEFFKFLAKQVQLKILVTDIGIANSVYGLSFETDESLDILVIKSLSEIKSVINKNFFDIVVLPPTDTCYQFICSGLAYQCCKKKGIKVVYWSEKWEARKIYQPFPKKVKNMIHALMISFFAKRADLCISAGTMSKQYLIKHGVTSEHISIAYDSSTSPQVDRYVNIRELYDIPQDASIVLFLGRLIERKGLGVLIRAFYEVLKHESNTYLLIGGTGDIMDYYRKLISEMHIKNIVFAGKVEPNERSMYYSQSNVFVLPSYSYKGIIEAWGLTVNEALEQGTPVIATDAVGAAYDIANGRECIMIPENNTLQLVNSIIMLLSKEKNSVDCKKLYNQFSVENMAQQFIDALFTLK